MPIEGPLRELGIHDVFQLLDLSRKTGTLRVTSELRDNEGIVYFETGRVLYANMRSNPHTLGQLLLRSGKVMDSDLERARTMQERGDHRKIGEILVEIGAITARELERQFRLQVEAVVFELMSWREGFFSFEERSVGEVPSEATVRISTESLLMEGARRIDEWSRIADKVPNLAVVPVLAPVNDDHPTLLDLLPNEWEVLSIIDAQMDIRAISSTLARSDFEIAKIVYGLLTTGVIEIRVPERVSMSAAIPLEDPTPFIEKSVRLLASGNAEPALEMARQAINADPLNSKARLAAARALMRMGRWFDSAEELRRAAQNDAHDPDIQLELGYSAIRRGDFEEAISCWERFIIAMPSSPHAERVRSAMESASRLRSLVEAHAGV